MCNPLVFAAVSAYGQERAAEYEAGVAENNAKIAEYQKADAIQQGAYDARKIKTQARREAATARANVTAGGLNANTGSIGNALADYEAQAAVDAERAKVNAVRAAWGLDIERDELKARAKMTRRTGVMSQLGTMGRGAADYYATKKADGNKR